MTDDDIEASILRYIVETVKRSDFPSRGEAIRRITGESSVLPSAVARVIARMIEAGTLKHGPGDQLNIKR